jgi:predicted DNA-binding transcriptional regulator YafY
LRDDGRGPDRRLWIDPSYSRQGVQLSLLEFISLRFGRTLFNFLQGTQFSEDMDDALDRLGPLTGNSAPLVDHLDRKLLAVSEHAKDHTRDSERLDEVLSALLYQNPARAWYAKHGSPTRSYLLHPLTLATYRQGLYLFALHVEEDKIKTFAIERFRKFERRRGEHFVYPQHYHPQEVVADCFGILSGPIEHVKLRFDRSEAPYITERRWHASQVVETDVDGGVVLQMRVGVSEELIRWLLGFGPRVEVLAPAFLSDKLYQLHEAAAQRRGTRRPRR